jgi:hypothetical protein
MHRESVWAAHSLSFSGARCFLSHSHQVGILFFFLFSFLFGLSIRTSFRLDYFATFPEEIAAAMERGWWRRIAQP